MGRPKENLLVRFWSKVNIGGEDDCWEWMGAVNQTGGYGMFGICHNQMVMAHRFAWEFVNGPIPPNTFKNENSILHRCDNPPCCNPGHLRLGTHQQNMEDMRRKGRGFFRPGFWRGRKNPAAKLTAEQVHEIRIAKGTFEEIANRFGIKQPQVTRIKQRSTWTHLPEAHGPFEPELKLPAVKKAVGRPRCKLTESQVYAIRADPDRVTVIAHKYGVGQPLITLIKQRKSWKHLPELEPPFILEPEILNGFESPK